ncbi:MAG: TIGR02444 family protein [Gammaproteobacteria bacterium]|nr:TIGR02444 family protein [Gammaproteobacteria bacterium]
MPGSELDKDIGLWEFTLIHYGSEGVQPAVIALQDKHGADVNLLFFCCWMAATERGRLSKSQIAETDTCVEHWRKEVTRPLRRVRDTIKGVQQLADLEGAMDVRAKVLAAEVESERIAQNAMESIARKWHRLGERDRFADAVANLATYVQWLGADSDREDTGSLNALIHAVFPESDLSDLDWNIAVDE